jgi:hypothetical protein
VVLLAGFDAGQKGDSRRPAFIPERKKIFAGRRGRVGRSLRARI